MRTPRQTRSGMTLAELAVVLVVLVALAALVVPMFSRTTQNAEVDVTFQTMMATRNAIVGGGTGPSYLLDNKGYSNPTRPTSNTTSGTDPDALAGIPFNIQDLFVNPGVTAFNANTRRGWRGPYLTQTAGVGFGGNAILDSFPTKTRQPGTALGLIWPAVGTTNRAYQVFLVSYGGDGKPDIDYSKITSPADLATQNLKDDLILYLRVAPGAGGTPYTNYYTRRTALETP